jgi:hypothetical protein
MAPFMALPFIAVSLPSIVRDPHGQLQNSALAVWGLSTWVMSVTRDF